MKQFIRTDKYAFAIPFLVTLVIWLPLILLLDSPTVKASVYSVVEPMGISQTVIGIVLLLSLIGGCLITFVALLLVSENIRFSDELAPVDSVRVRGRGRIYLDANSISEQVRRVATRVAGTELRAVRVIASYGCAMISVEVSVEHAHQAAERSQQLRRELARLIADLRIMTAGAPVIRMALNPRERKPGGIPSLFSRLRSEESHLPRGGSLFGTSSTARSSSEPPAPPSRSVFGSRPPKSPFGFPFHASGEGMPSTPSIFGSPSAPIPPKPEESPDSSRTSGAVFYDAFSDIFQKYDQQDFEDSDSSGDDLSADLSDDLSDGFFDAADLSDTGDLSDGDDSDTDLFPPPDLSRKP